MKLEVTTSGDFNNTVAWCQKVQTLRPQKTLNSIGAQGVTALSAMTPVGETGKTAAGWSYKVSKTGSGWEVAWYNHAHPETTANVALLLQYGHGTGTGGYIPGRDYINPALQGIFAKGSQQITEEMTK